MTVNFYQNNDLVLTQKEINILENHFTLNNNIQNWDDFKRPVKNLLEKSFPVYEYYKTQFETNLGLQGGKILEIVIGETLANILNAKYISKNVFENENYKITLTGDNGKSSGTVYDIEILEKDGGFVYIGEIKDTIARCGEADLKYDEQGHLFPAPRSTRWDDSWFPVLNAFNENTSMFNIFGHNFQISQYKDACAAVTNNYFSGVDYLFTYKNDKLITIPMNNFDVIKTLFSFSGSEIRSSGKNPVNVFTPKYLEEQILSSKYFISKDENSYTMDSSILTEKTGRGGGTSSRYGFIPGFIVRKDGVIFDENICIIPKNNIKQLNSNISVHIKLDMGYDEIKEIYGEGE